ncbi:hypothetical protein SAMN03097699_2797 [Flavobacteriaceae bacterium MAR_2010_188]|nr:hypothetical protein SAMN03097699_2797 [Flavobacteriaceae bacterium MAR_2010_188]
MRKIVFFFFLFSAFCFKSFSQFKQIETDDFIIISSSMQLDYVLNHSIRCSHNALDFHRKLFDYEPSEKIFIIFQDFGDYGNGGATSLPINLISTCISPLNYSFESSVAGERVFSIMNHELVHVAALDNASKSDLFYRKVFHGKVKSSDEHPISMLYSYLTNPRYYSPRWLHEGIAVFVETWMDGGQGNALGNYDEMFFRTRVLEDSRIYTPLALASAGTSADFMSKANFYYYGTRFVSYLANEYGPDKLIDWVKRKDDSKRGFESNFEYVFGLPLTDSWDNWIAFEKDFQHKNIEKLEEFPISQDSLITEKVLGGVSHAYHDEKRNNIYVAVNYPGKIPHIASIDLATGKIKRLVDVKGPTLFNVTSLAYDEKNDLLFYTTDNDEKRDINSFNLKTGQAKLLQKDTRIGDLAFNKQDESLWGVKHLNGISTLVRIPKRDIENPSRLYSKWEQKYTLPYGQDMFDLDISPDGKSLSSAVTDLNGNQFLNIYEINSIKNEEKDSIKFKEVFNFEVASPQSFKYSKDGTYLIGSSYYSGVSNIFKVDTNTFDIEILTNALTGYFRPVPIDDEKIFSFKYRSDGFAPVYVYNKEDVEVGGIDFLGNETVEKYPELKEWTIEVPNQDTNFDDESLNAKEGVYSANKEFRLNYAYPIVVGYKNKFGLGYYFRFQDPIGLKALDFSLSYTPNSFTNGIDGSKEDIDKDEAFHASINYSVAKLSGAFAGKYDFYATYNNADFYDLFGPTKRSREGLNVGMEYGQSLIYDPPRNLDLKIGANAYYGLSQSPDFQQINFVDGAFNTNLFYNLYGSLFYRNLKGSVGAVDAEKGVKSSLTVSSSVTEGNFFPKAHGTFDIGFQLPINHTAIWIRNAAGNSFTKTFNPFTRYGFASFGNNYIDNANSKMYRDPFSFAGLSYNADKTIIAKSFYKATLDLILPPIHYQKFGFFNFFATYSHPTIFAGSLFTKNYDDSILEDGSIVGEYSENFKNVGFQVDTKLTMFSHLSSTFSFGWAKAFSQGSNSKTYDEWMVSLKF